jgi:hypothetical protein
MERLSDVVCVHDPTAWTEFLLDVVHKRITSLATIKSTGCGYRVRCFFFMWDLLRASRWVQSANAAITAISGESVFDRMPLESTSVISARRSISSSRTVFGPRVAR